MTTSDLAARLSELQRQAQKLNPRPVPGAVLRAAGSLMRATLAGARLGELCEVRDDGLGGLLTAEVVGLEGDEVILAPMGEMIGLSSSAEIERTGAVLRVPVG